MMGPFWSMAVIRGTCKVCGRILERDTLVNRDWTNHMADGIKAEEPIPFGYMGDCACGKAVGGHVSWPYLAVFEEREEP